MHMALTIGSEKCYTHFYFFEVYTFFYAQVIEIKMGQKTIM